jgi:hypothetical protein
MELMNPAHFFMEIGQDSLKAFNGTAGLELPLERQADGKLTETCKNKLTLALQKFIDRKSWQPRARVFCAIGARGVSLRRLSLPASSKEELNRLLPLQIEREFPLPPDQLAWGCQPLGGRGMPPNSPNGKQELLVVAVKKDSLEEYASILSACGATPVFSLAALARSYVCPEPPGAYAVLAVERNYSELITVDAGMPVSVRVLSWGLQSFPDLAEKARGNGRDEAVGLLAPSSTGVSFGGAGTAADLASTAALDPLARLVNAHPVGRRVYVMGVGERPTGFDFATQLGNRLGGGVECQAVELAPREVGSSAILGLQRAVERGAGMPPLVLQLKQNNRRARAVREAPLKWAAIAASLALLALILPYAEALTLKSHLAKKLAAIKTDQGRLATIDRELDFLQYLKESEPPYLDALLVLAKAAPPSTRFDSVSMNRRGDVSLRGSLRDGQQVAELRTKLIDSGFFSNVGIEEQTPTPDRQKVNVRMSAQWKPAGARVAPPAEPIRSPTGPKGSPNQASATGAPPGNGIPAPVVKPPSIGSSKN